MSHSTTNCYGCGEQMRTELLHNHIISNHPTYFWDDLFTFQLREGVIEPVSTMQLREAYNLLQTNAPYKTEPDVYIDFGGNQAYKKVGTAMNNIQRHPDQHVQNYIDTLKQGLNKDSLKQLIQFVLRKPLKVIDDENEVRRRVQKQLDEEISKFHNEISMMREENYRAKLFMGRDEIKEIERLRVENKALQSTNWDLRESQSAVSINLTDLESMRMKSIAQQKEAIEYYEKATKQHKADMKKMNEDCDKKMKKMDEDCDKKMKKMEEDCDKKMKKMKDDCDKKMEKVKEQISELTAKYEKIDKKQKKEIKKYQKQIKSMQSDSSDSDSD